VDAQPGRSSSAGRAAAL